MSVDLETRDPELIERGPGDIRGDGEVVGIALAADGFARYYPIGHGTGPNCEVEPVVRYVRDVLERAPAITGANLYYDLGWARTLGIDLAPFACRIEDVQLLEPLIDEEAISYSLENIMRKYLGRGKREEELKEAARAAGYKDHKGNLWRLPATAVGAYAEEDVRGPLEVLALQKKEIEAQGLHEVLALEQDIFWVVLEMRRMGVRVDLTRALELDNKYVEEESGMLVDIAALAGFECNPWSPDDLVRLFVQENLQFETTPKGNPSFEAEFLGQIDHPIVQKCVEYRKVSKMRRDFIHGGVIDWSINGRIHPEMHPLRGETHGTRVGRFSYSRPNLQQQPSPSRDKFWGPLIRSLYVPEPEERWARFDYSQQEPRLTVHFAALRGFPQAAEDARMYIENPATDFHQFVADMVGIARRPAKDINLGMTYGMGRKKIISQLGVDQRTGIDYWNRYHKRFPYIRMLSEEAMQLASTRGYIRTIGGRRKRFNRWNPVDWDLRKKDGYRAYAKDEATEKWPEEPLCRAFTHKALNNLIQGSGGDVTKRAMIDAFKAGYVPLIQVHDELDYSLESDEEAKEIKDIMEAAYNDRMKLPFKVDMTVGENWGVCS